MRARRSEVASLSLGIKNRSSAMGLAGEQNRARRTKPVDGTRTGRSGVGFATGHPASSRGWSSQYTSTGSSGWEGGGNCIGKNAEEEKCIRGGFLNTFQDGRTWRRLLAVSCCGGSPVFVEVLLPCEQRGNVGSSAKRGNWLVL